MPERKRRMTARSPKKPPGLSAAFGTLGGKCEFAAVANCKAWLRKAAIRATKVYNCPAMAASIYTQNPTSDPKDVERVTASHFRVFSSAQFYCPTLTPNTTAASAMKKSHPATNATCFQSIVAVDGGDSPISGS